MTFRQTIFSALVLAAPGLMLGQSDERALTQPPETRITLKEVTVNPPYQVQNQVSCIGNFSGHYNVVVPENRYQYLTAQDQAFDPTNEFRPLQSSGCGYNTVSPNHGDTAFRK